MPSPAERPLTLTDADPVVPPVKLSSKTTGAAEYTPAQVKVAVTGSGVAGKPQVQAMIQRLLTLDSAPASDAADALAVAICDGHSGSSPGAGRVARALAREARS